jgi:hypothetical protein
VQQGTPHREHRQETECSGQGRRGAIPLRWSTYSLGNEPPKRTGSVRAGLPAHQRAELAGGKRVQALFQNNNLDSGGTVFTQRQTACSVPPKQTTPTVLERKPATNNGTERIAWGEIRNDQGFFVAVPRVQNDLQQMNVDEQGTLMNYVHPGRQGRPWITCSAEYQLRLQPPDR